MRCCDFEFVVYDCSILCLDCAGSRADSEDASPIFADSEWNYAPACEECGEVCEYVTVLQPPEDRDAEAVESL
jgi:hypothetical protein